jgi:hypothetical protein
MACRCDCGGDLRHIPMGGHAIVALVTNIILCILQLVNDSAMRPGAYIRTGTRQVNTVRTAEFVRKATLLSAIWTLLMAAPIFAWQIVSWANTGEWTPFPISRVLELADLGPPAVYETASSTGASNVAVAGHQGVPGWFLEFPVIGILLAVAALFFIFTFAAASIQKKMAANSE